MPTCETCNWSGPKSDLLPFAQLINGRATQALACPVCGPPEWPNPGAGCPTCGACRMPDDSPPTDEGCARCPPRAPEEAPDEVIP